MKKILTGVVLLIILVVLLWIGFSKQRYFKQVTLPQYTQITNFSKMPFADTIVSIGLDSLNMGNTIVIIKDLTQSISENINIAGESNDLKGTIIPYVDDSTGITYFEMYLSEMSRYEAIDVIAHELIHVKQYKDKRLSIKSSNGYVLWDGIKHLVSMETYEERPWEIDAFNNQVWLSKKISRTLLK